MLNVLFAGTPEFAVASLEALAATPVADVVGVLTQPDRPRGRGRRVTPSPVKVSAEAHGLTVLQPDHLDDPAFLASFDALAPDLMVVAAYGRILTQSFIDRPRLGSINVHASLLPRWRGAAPIQRALMAGDSETGITIMRVVRELDAGPIILARALPIGAETSYPELHDALAKLGGETLVAALAQAGPDGFASELPQDPAQVTYAHKITGPDCVVDWHGAAGAIDRQVRALTPRPGAAADVAGFKVKLLAGRPFGGAADAAPGTLVTHGPEGIVVACGEGLYTVSELKPEGKGRMSAAAFSNGYLSRRAAAR
mgnify:CR=1 FL=1